MIHDEEYQRYKEEMANTLKMSLILKSLNTNSKKTKNKKTSKSLAVSNSGMQGLSSGSLGSRTKIGMPGTGANMTSAQVSNQDINEL